MAAFFPLSDLKKNIRQAKGIVVIGLSIYLSGTGVAQFEAVLLSWYEFTFWEQF